MLRRRNLVIERIVNGARTGPTLYDQTQDEWVLLVQGYATLESAAGTLDMGPGDHVLIPAHMYHRVMHTPQEPRCLCLAVHLYPGAGSD